ATYGSPLQPNRTLPRTRGTATSCACRARHTHPRAAPSRRGPRAPLSTATPGPKWPGTARCLASTIASPESPCRQPSCQPSMVACPKPPETRKSRATPPTMNAAVETLPALFASLHRLTPFGSAQRSGHAFWASLFLDMVTSPKTVPTPSPTTPTPPATMARIFWVPSPLLLLVAGASAPDCSGDDTPSPTPNVMA